jgi:hypothetical protein
MVLGAARLNGVASILGLNPVNPCSGAKRVNPEHLRSRPVDRLIGESAQAGPKQLNTPDNPRLWQAGLSPDQREPATGCRRVGLAWPWRGWACQR